MNEGKIPKIIILLTRYSFVNGGKVAGTIFYQKLPCMFCKYLLTFIRSSQQFYGDQNYYHYAHIFSQGRKGRGSIYVWASGDGGPDDDCNCDGYAASMWTISINSVTNDGETAGYDESCSSTLASTFSNGKSGYEDAGVVS